MSWRSLPPVGDPIALTAEQEDLPAFAGFQPIWTDCGTSALALALLIAKQRCSQVRSPEVILPGYACPDLVAAAVYAGVRPVLADIGAEDPGYDLESISKALSSNTVAVIAVNFLGIRERLPQLRALLSHRPDVLLIEDDAQWFPETQPGFDLQGDMVCISFGRGKPVSLLGGGALLVREALLPELDSELLWLPRAAEDGTLSWKIRAYNLLLHPSLYGFIRRLAFLNLGQTVFKPLPKATAMDARRINLLAANVRRYLSQHGEASRRMREIVPLDMNLPASLAGRVGRLLRYPILCVTAKQRDLLWKRLDRAGLGVTVMYGRALPEIPGVRDLVSNNGVENSYRFAGRLLTLPVHRGVATSDVERIVQIIQQEVEM